MDQKGDQKGEKLLGSRQSQYLKKSESREQIAQKPSPSDIRKAVR